MKHSPQAGFVLLMDLMLSMLLMSVLSAMEVPRVVLIQRTNKTFTAKARVANLAGVESAISLCNATPGCHPAVALRANTFTRKHNSTGSLPIYFHESRWGVVDLSGDSDGQCL